MVAMFCISNLLKPSVDVLKAGWLQDDLLTSVFARNLET